MKRLFQRYPFLKFLAPVLDKQAPDSFRLNGDLKVEARTPGREPVIVYDDHNFIVDLGKTAVRNLLLGPAGGGAYGAVCRMAVGDGGVLPGELFNPKTPDVTWPARTGLFHEVIRQDVTIYSTPAYNAARFVGTFNSVDVDLTSFSLAEHVINEAALVIGDGTVHSGGGKKQINKVPPDTPYSGESLLSMRTFRSTPFDPSQSVIITITWTMTVVTA